MYKKAGYHNNNEANRKFLFTRHNFYRNKYFVLNFEKYVNILI